MMTVYGWNMKPECNILHTSYHCIDVVVYWRYIIYYTIVIAQREGFCESYYFSKHVWQRKFLYRQNPFTRSDIWAHSLTVKDFDARRPDGSSRCWVSQHWATHGGSWGRKSGYQQHFRTVHSSCWMTLHMLGTRRCLFNVTVSTPSTSQAKCRSDAHCTSNYARKCVIPVVCVKLGKGM